MQPEPKKGLYETYCVVTFVVNVVTILLCFWSLSLFVVVTDSMLLSPFLCLSTGSMLFSRDLYISVGVFGVFLSAKFMLLVKLFRVNFIAAMVMLLSLGFCHNV